MGGSRFDGNDREYLANLIEDNLDEVAEESNRAYVRLYGYSSSTKLPEDAQIEWAAYDMRAIARVVRTGEADPMGYEGYGGDIVLQRDPLFAPIANYVEGRLYMAKILAGFIWRREVADHRRRARLLDCLETSIQEDVRVNAEAFLEDLCAQRRLVHTWRLDAVQSLAGFGEESWPPASLAQPPVSSDATTVSDGGYMGLGDAASEDAVDAPAPLPLSSLTPRELQVFDLICDGKQNAEIAAQLGLQRSTVKNAVSRVFAKFGVGTRTELVIVAHDLGIR